MYVCLCRGVSDRTIRRLVREGARCPAEVASRCGAGTACGSCVSDVAALVDAERVVTASMSASAAEESLAAK